MEGTGVVKGTSDLILLATQITMLTVGNLAIIQQSMSGFWWNFQDASAIVQWTIDYIFGVIYIAMLTLHIGNPGNMGVMSCLGQGCLSALVSYYSSY